MRVGWNAPHSIHRLPSPLRAVMRIATIVWCCYILLGSVVVEQVYARQQRSGVHESREREAVVYELAGPFDLRLDLTAQARASREAQARAFLWEHWRDRRRGRLSVIRYSKEGESSESVYFVEPDGRNVWHVKVTIEQVLIDRGVDRPRRHTESVEQMAYSVDRLDVREDHSLGKVVLPDGDSRSSRLYRLVLKDVVGNKLIEF